MHKEDPTTRERILVVEDEIITAIDLCASLRQLGSEPLGPGASRQETITNALTLHPDAILIDIILKGTTDGIQASQVILAR